MGSQSFEAAFEADITLVSREVENPMKFHVHKCILASASPFFYDMFSLPQNPKDDVERPIIPMSEPSAVIEALLRFVYPVEDPVLTSLDELVPILCGAVKYDFTSVVSTIGKILVSPRFVEPEPTRVFAIAARFEMEEEARIASKYTLNVNVLEGPLSEDLKHITAHSYIRLVALHKRRVDAATAMLKRPQEVKCMQCNGSSFSVYPDPKWWMEWERMAKAELSLRPTTVVIFNMEFLAQAAMASGCSKCAGSVLASWKPLEELKRKIDELPSTI